MVCDTFRITCVCVLKELIFLVLNTKFYMEECYFMRQDNTVYKFSIKLSFSSIRQDKSKLYKQISTLLILIAVTAFKISNLLICFCNFDWSCPILVK